MGTTGAIGTAAIRFDSSPERYRHWRLGVDGPVATLVLDVAEDAPLRPGYELKLNSYDLGVDIELADAVQRLRFEHPEVGAVIVTSGKEKVFCAGANIRMLAQASHELKVNFCKFTNETRLAIEDSPQHYVCALNGTASGGGYELALACDDIVLVDDHSSAVSLPEVALLAVLPGTGGLTRLVDKRKVRRDLADVFSTKAEGVRGEQALRWGLVDALVPRSRFDEVVRARALDAAGPSRAGRGIALVPLERELSDLAVAYEHVRVDLDRGAGTATLTVTAPTKDPHAWPLAAARQLDDGLLHLRFNEPELGTIVLRTSGDPDAVLAAEETLTRDDWLAHETLGLWRRTLKRLDNTSRSLVAVVDRGSCFAGLLLELALAADRSYMLDDPTGPALLVTPLNLGGLPMGNGLSRLESRGIDPASGAYDAPAALDAGLVTFAPDDLDWDDEIRLAIEERASFSPDALTGMEASLRFAGPETMETKIFGRLSAWQNWVFQRPNAHAALERYGTGIRPQFDRRRT